MMTTFLRTVTRLAIALTLLPAVGAFSCARAQSKPQTQNVAMSDGVELATDVYLPESGKPPHPTILIRTPYNKAGNRGNGRLSRRVLVFVRALRR